MIRVRLREVMHRRARATGQNITYASLAEQTGLSRATIEAIGSRTNYLPSLRAIDELCTALNCDVAELLEHSPARNSRRAR